MEPAPHPKVSTPDVTMEPLRRDLRGAGLRATGARIAVLGVLRTAGRPMSHAEVVEHLAGEPWDRATLYRNLVDLARVGLLRRVVLGGRVWRFEDVDDPSAAHAHAHFVCVDCGTIACVPGVTVTLAEAATLEEAVSGTDLEVQLRGRCRACE